mgnify:CR=1 FL=1
MKNKVILISIDGMRPDGFLRCGHPFVHRMLEQFSYTLSGRSVNPPVTLPCHMSMFYGVPPARHGILTNTYTVPVRPVNGIGELLAAASRKAVAFYNWEPIRHVWPSESMKYSSYINAYEEENSDLLLTCQAVSLLTEREPDFIFLYLVETDEKGGHDHGWMTEEYLRQIHNAVGCVEKIFQAASKDYHILVTADHGGHDRTHGVNCPEDMTIPMFFWGGSLPKGKELQNLSLLDLAPAIASILGLPASREWTGHSPFPFS